MYAIYDIEDRWHSAVCLSAQEVGECLSNIGYEPGRFPTIMFFDEDEFARNVTEDFLPGEIEEEPDHPAGERECVLADRLIRERKEGVR